ncbi:MAG: NusG domain II-containing protein [Candidatus Weimeria sp.]
MKENTYISKKSIIVIAVILALLGLFCVFFYSTRTQGNTVVVTHDGKQVGAYPLDKDRTIVIRDSNGKVTNTVVIKNGEVYMKSADCPDQICVHQGRKSKNGESITCLPNKVFVEVKGKNKSSVDTMTN